MSVYSKKEMVYERGFLDNSVDATYIIHLEGNGRLQNIYNQLNQYQPTKKVYIFFNKGYKNCNKNFYNNANLKRHIEKYCKKNNNDNSIIDENIIESLPIDASPIIEKQKDIEQNGNNNINNISNSSNSNITNNSNNINININITR